MVGHKPDRHPRRMEETMEAEQLPPRGIRHSQVLRNQTAGTGDRGGEIS